MNGTSLWKWLRHLPSQMLKKHNAKRSTQSHSLVSRHFLLQFNLYHRQLWPWSPSPACQQLTVSNSSRGLLRSHPAIHTLRIQNALPSCQAGRVYRLINSQKRVQNGFELVWPATFSISFNIPRLHMHIRLDVTSVQTSVHKSGPLYGV